MAVAWPTKFPQPQRKNYQARVELPLLQSQFPASTKRRRTDETTQHVITFKFWFTKVQFDYLFSWIRYKIHEGTDPFDIGVRDGSTVHTLTVFLDKNTLQWVLHGDAYQVTFDTRINQVTTPVEGTLDAWLIS